MCARHSNAVYCCSINPLRERSSVFRPRLPRTSPGFAQDSSRTCRGLARTRSRTLQDISGLPKRTPRPSGMLKVIAGRVWEDLTAKRFWSAEDSGVVLFTLQLVPDGASLLVFASSMLDKGNLKIYNCSPTREAICNIFGIRLPMNGSEIRTESSEIKRWERCASALDAQG